MVTDPSDKSLGQQALSIGVFSAFIAASYAVTSRSWVGKRLPSRWLRMSSMVLPPLGALSLKGGANRAMDLYLARANGGKTPGTKTSEAGQEGADTAREVRDKAVAKAESAAGAPDPKKYREGASAHIAQIQKGAQGLQKLHKGLKGIDKIFRADSNSLQVIADRLQLPAVASSMSLSNAWPEDLTVKKM